MISSHRLFTLLKNNRGSLLFFVLMFCFRSSFADWNSVPTGSMKPTIIEGDRILTNKMAYDIRIPFTPISLIRLAEPERGDIVIFDSKMSDKRLVKRVIGLPGDVIEMNNNVLRINGQILNYQTQQPTTKNATNRMDKTENLLGTQHTIRVHQHGSIASTFGPIKVPNEHLFVLGDNRDNSGDSRMIGFIPRTEVVGRTRRVVMSLNDDNYYLPREGRFLKTL